MVGLGADPREGRAWAASYFRRTVNGAFLGRWHRWNAKLRNGPNVNLRPSRSPVCPISMIFGVSQFDCGERARIGRAVR